MRPISWRHHDWGADVLILFNKSVGNAYGLYLGTSDFPDLPFDQVRYLDADMSTIDTRAVVRHDMDVGW